MEDRWRNVQRQQVAILEDKLESQLQDRNICYCSGCGSSFKLLLPKETFSDYSPRHQQWQCVAMVTRKSDYGAAKFKEQKMSIGPGCSAYSAPKINKSLNQTAKVR